MWVASYLRAASIKRGDRVDKGLKAATRGGLFLGAVIWRQETSEGGFLFEKGSRPRSFLAASERRALKARRITTQSMFVANEVSSLTPGPMVLETVMVRK